MKHRASSYNLLISLVTFMALELVSIVMISSNSILQRFIIMDKVRSTQIFFWRQSEKIHDFLSLRSANQALQEENAILRSKLSQVEHYAADHREEIENYQGVYDFIPATIIKNTPDKQHNYMILDKGAEDGVCTEMGVVTHNSIVGVVSAVSDHYCYVLSFMNKNQKVSAMISGTEYFGILSWDGQSQKTATLSQISLSSMVAVGDTICTSGYSTIYPSGIPVGTVAGIKDVGGMYKNMTIDLLQDISSLKYVYLVRRHDQDEIDSLSAYHDKAGKKQ